MSLLEHINSPDDLKKLSMEQLSELAAEIRKFLIDNVTKTGGHIASNLGVVELTLALHYVFDSPVDKIVFDVGHQSYVHKLITGRREDFGTLRSYGGISGFPKPSESEHDAFKTGHSSTSVSVAAGLVRARRITGGSHHVIAVIGDGAMTGGMAFEAMNDIGQESDREDGGDKVIIVLNDNEMSIDRNVGAMHTHFSKMRTGRGYFRFKQTVERTFTAIPLIGKPLVKVFSRAKRAVKSIFVHEMMFEELGFTYIGIVDGHNIPKLIAELERAKGAPKSVLIHVKTQKGKGLQEAEDAPEKYHGISPEGEGGKSNSGIFGDALLELAREDDRIVAVTAAMTSGTGLAGFAKELPERFFDVGIAEQHGAALCGAMAAGGLLPVFAVYSTFLQRAYDQLIHDICLQHSHVVIGVDRAGLVGADGETHHGAFDIAFLRHIPGASVLAPANTAELRAMLRAAVLDMGGLVCIRYPRERLPEAAEVQGDVRRSVVLRPLSDVNVIACGQMVGTALAASDRTGCGVVNARALKPLDEEVTAEVLRAGRTIVIEDGTASGGFGSSVLEFAAGMHIKADITPMGLPDRFMQHGTAHELAAEAGLDLESLVAEISKKNCIH